MYLVWFDFFVFATQQLSLRIKITTHRRKSNPQTRWQLQPFGSDTWIHRSRHAYLKPSRHGSSLKVTLLDLLLPTSNTTLDEQLTLRCLWKGGLSTVFLLVCFVFSFCFLSEGPPYWSNCLFTSCDFLFRPHLDCLATKCFAAVCTPLLIFSLHCWWNWLFASSALILHNCCKSEMLRYQDSAGC